VDEENEASDRNGRRKRRKKEGWKERKAQGDKAAGKVKERK
jgi:hypothetical protein